MCICVFSPHGTYHLPQWDHTRHKSTRSVSSQPEPQPERLVAYSIKINYLQGWKAELTYVAGAGYIPLNQATIKVESLDRSSHESMNEINVCLFANGQTNT